MLVFEINIYEANKALVINFFCQIYRSIRFSLYFCHQTKHISMDILRPIQHGFRALLKELNNKPKSYQLIVSAIVGFVLAFPTIHLVKAFAFVTGVVVLGLSMMNKFVLDIPVQTPNLHLDRIKALVLENAVFCTGLTSGYLIGMKFT